VAGRERSAAATRSLKSSQKSNSRQEHEQETDRSLRPLDVVLRRADGNQSKAAEWLGINRNTLRRKLLEHKLVDR